MAFLISFMGLLWGFFMLLGSFMLACLMICPRWSASGSGGVHGWIFGQRVVKHLIGDRVVGFWG